MDRTIDETVDSIRAQLASVEGYVTTFAGAQFEPLVEVSRYGESMGFNRVVVHHVNCNTCSQSDIHHRPETTMELATVEPNVQSLVGHHHNEIRRGNGHICLPIPTVYHTETEPVKRVCRGEKTCNSDDNDRYRQDYSQTSRSGNSDYG